MGDCCSSAIIIAQETYGTLHGKSVLTAESAETAEKKTEKSLRALRTLRLKKKNLYETL
jgi:hypothetical protein